MKTKNILAAFTLLAASLCPTMAQAQSDEAKMNTFIDNLMNPFGLFSRLPARCFPAVLFFPPTGADRVKIQKLHPLQHNRRTFFSGDHFLLQLRDE